MQQCTNMMRILVFVNPLHIECHDIGTERILMSQTEQRCSLSVEMQPPNHRSTLNIVTIRLKISFVDVVVVKFTIIPKIPHINNATMVSHRFFATLGLLATVIGARAADSPPKLVCFFFQISFPLNAPLYIRIQ